MTFRMPQSLAETPRNDTGAEVLEIELMAERAAALGRGGREVAEALQRLRDFDAAGRDAVPGAVPGAGPGAHTGPVARAALVAAAAEAVWGFLVHRELCGLCDWADVVREYGIPPEVLNRLGAR